jgi:hypothetical protein
MAQRVGRHLLQRRVVGVALHQVPDPRGLEENIPLYLLPFLQVLGFSGDHVNHQICYDQPYSRLYPQSPLSQELAGSLTRAATSP